MHSSRMRTARGSSRPRGGVYLSACWDTPPPRCWPGDPPGVGLETPLGCGPGDPPPNQTPQLPPWVWAWRLPHWRPARHAGIPSPDQETCCKTCWDTTCNACWDTPPRWTEFLTHTSENITLPQTSFASGNNFVKSK